MCQNYNVAKIKLMTRDTLEKKFLPNQLLLNLVHMRDFRVALKEVHIKHNSCENYTLNFNQSYFIDCQ